MSTNVVKKMLRKLLIVVGSLLLTQVSHAMCSGVPAGYEKRDDGWYYGRKLEGIDVATFHILSGKDSTIGDIPCVRLGSEYAADKSHVYMSGHVIPGADPATFSFVGSGYTRDAHHVYLIGRVLDGADPKPFEQVGQSRFFKDSNHVYMNGQLVKDALASSFSSVGSGDYPANVMGRDAVHVFYEASAVPGADPQHVKVVGRQYWISHRRVYAGDKAIGPVDPTTFVASGPNEVACTAEDKNQYFWNDRAFSKSACRKVGDIILACKGFSVVFGKKYPQIDSTSLRYLGRFPGGGAVPMNSRVYQDSQHVYAVSGDGQVLMFDFRQRKAVENLNDTLPTLWSGNFQRLVPQE